MIAIGLATLLFADVDATTLDGKVLFGYQGWFRTPGDGTTTGWSHWSRGVPSPSTMTVDLYPDLSEFDRQDLAAIPGQPSAFLFSSANPRVVDRHFDWMRDYGLDGVLVQRFLTDVPRLRREGDVVLRNAMRAAERTGRVFAIEYDVSGADPERFVQQTLDDWRYLVDQVGVARSRRYLRPRGRPLVSIWGMGLAEKNHPPTDPATATGLVAEFKRQGATVMGGVPAYWRTGKRDAAPGWDAYWRSLDVVQPWTVGRYAHLDEVDRWRTDQIEPDLRSTQSVGQAYMPVVFPGFSWHNLNPKSPPNQIPRHGGAFLWRQARNARAAGATTLKIAMFDEVNEGTAMFKASPQRSTAPADGYWLTLDADGEKLRSDHYLRLAGRITTAFHARTTLPERW